MRRVKDSLIQVVCILVAVTAVSVSASPVCAQQDEDLYLEGREQLIEERYEQALAIFRRIVGDFPESGRADDAQFYMGFTLERMGRNEEAIESFGVLLERWPDSMRVEAARSHQIELMGETEDPGFQAYMERLLSETMSWEARRELALSMARSGDLSAAAVLEDIMRRESSSRQMELIRILGGHLTDPVARNIIAIGIDPSESSSVQLLALRTLKPVAAEPEVTAMIVPALSRSNSSSVQSEAIDVLSPSVGSPHVRQTIIMGLGRGYSSSVQLRAVKVLGNQLLAPGVKQAVVELLRRSASSSVKSALLDELRNEMNNPEISEVLGAAVSRGNSSSVQQKAMQIARTSSNPSIRSIARLGLAPSNSSSVQIEAVRALAEGENDPAAAEALELAALLHSNELINSALHDVLAPGSTPSSVQLKSIQLLERDIELPRVQQIVARGLHHSNPSSVQLAAVEALEPAAGEATVRGSLISALSRRNPSSVMLATMDVLDAYVSKDAAVKEAYINLMKRDVSSTARIRAATILLPDADAALKRVIADAMEQVVVRLYRNWRRRTFTGAPRLIEKAIDIVALIDRERADDLRSRYGRPPGLFSRLLGALQLPGLSYRNPPL